MNLKTRRHERTEHLTAELPMTSQIFISLAMTGLVVALSSLLLIAANNTRAARDIRHVFHQAHAARNGWHTDNTH
ncbi:MAG: hypothetical protein H6980_07535 [Gammaproteobacteria bacterium]|nr:hypothetical protein [Gammaproteobacteria bacterium]